MRKYAGTNIALNPGQKCFFWRDSRSADLVKIRWKGPATVLMKEEDDDGRVKIYWLAYKTQLLRAAPHHVRPEIGKTSEPLAGDFLSAKAVIQQLKSRGVTRYLDLNVLNKRRLEDVGTDEEVLDDIDSDLEPPALRRRLLDSTYEPPADVVYSPSVLPDDLDLDVNDLGLSDQQGPPPGFEATPAPTGILEPAQPGLVEADGAVNVPIPELTPDALISSGEPSREPSPTNEGNGLSQLPMSPMNVPRPIPEQDPQHQPLDSLQALQQNQIQPQQHLPPSPLQTDNQPSSLPSNQVPQLDPHTASLYQPATDEDFRSHRRRFEQQETMSFGPFRRRREQQQTTGEHGSRPYSEPASANEPPTSTDNRDDSLNAFDLEDIEINALPPGWKFEDGYITLDDHKRDYWELRAGCLIRHHNIPRRALFDPRSLSERDLKHMPVPLYCLDPVRVTICKSENGINHHSDKIEDGPGKTSSRPWTGCTVFQLNGQTRQELGCHAYSAMTAKQVGKKAKVHAQRQVRKAPPKNEISEKKLSLEDRVLFHQAKVKELKSFFDNGVWSFQTTKEAIPSRTMSSRMLLKWSKNADGTPRAKARLVVRGYTDADALEGKLDTASPASTRLGRSVLLSISACCGWCGWSADVSTAFLQGLPQERKLWVRLPADAVRILGGDENTRMFLHKPVYGQLDAPKRWFLEATRRLRNGGWTAHPMDPCFWRLYEPAEDGAEPVLCGLLVLHVDDMLGCGNPTQRPTRKPKLP